jgi:ATP:guanido phosphotransferase, C-terminal catalytic domain
MMLCTYVYIYTINKNRASVMLKLPKLYKAWGVHKLEDYCDKMGVQARGAKVIHVPT